MGRRIKIDEEALIKMLAGRNESALEILYDNYSAALYGVIYRIVQEHPVAEDLLQEAFLKIWNNFQQYDAAKGRLFSWMVNICRNLTIDKIRSREFSDSSKNRPLNNFVPVSEMATLTSYNEDLIGMKSIVEKLDPEYKLIIDLLYFRGYTQSETADHLNIPLGTVKTRSRAAIQKLRVTFDTGI